MNTAGLLPPAHGAAASVLGAPGPGGEAPPDSQVASTEPKHRGIREQQEALGLPMMVALQC